jgi:hypothetical protein
MSILDPASDDEAHLKKENPGVLFLIALMALFFWMLVPHLYLHATGSLPAPATQDNSHISPRQLSIAMTIMPLAGLLALIAGNLLYRDRPLKRLGVTSRHLKSALPRAAIAILIILPLIFGVGFATEWFFSTDRLCPPDRARLYYGRSPKITRLARASR